MNKNVAALAKHMRVTDKQLKFLDVYERTLSLDIASKESGIQKDKALISIKKGTPFGKLFERLSKELDKDPRFNKAGAIGMLIDLKDRARDAGKMELELKIIQEINKMISGNIAVTKKEVTKRTLNVEAVIDMTKPPKRKIEAEDVDFKEIEE